MSEIKDISESENTGHWANANPLVTLSCWTIYVSELTFIMMIEGATKFLQALRRQYYNNRVFLPLFTITPSQIQSSTHYSLKLSKFAKHFVFS